MQQALLDVLDHHSRIIFLSGEAGIGKTRLINEIKERAIQAKMLILQGNCYEQDQTFPFGLWIEEIRSWLSKVPDVEFFQRIITPFASDFIKLIPEITERIPDVVPNPALDSESEKRRLFETWGRFFSRVGQEQPHMNDV